MGRKIAIVSGKGGVGKTTMTCGVGIALAKMGYSVCLVDLDIGLNNLDVLLGVENKVVYDLGDCLSGRCRIKQALINDLTFENLYLLPSVRFEDYRVGKEEIKCLTDKLAGVFDFVLIDAPAGIGANFEMAIAGVNEVLVVVTPHLASLRDADKIIGRLKGVGIDNIGVVINRIRGDLVARKEMLSHEQIAKLLKNQIIAVVPESDDVNIYSSFKFEKISKGEDIEVFNIFAHNLKSDKKIIYDYESRYKGLLGRIRRKIKRSI